MFASPGEARDDRDIFIDVAKAIGQPLPYTSAAEVRAALADALSSNPAYAELRSLTFARPVGARHWLQGSNPSERWKWDFMFQDMPPVKFDWMPMPPSNSGVIPLRPVADAPARPPQDTK